MGAQIRYWSDLKFVHVLAERDYYLLVFNLFLFLVVRVKLCDMRLLSTSASSFTGLQMLIRVCMGRAPQPHSVPLTIQCLSPPMVLPRLYPQESTYEVLNEKQDDSFFIEYNEHEFRFPTTPNCTTYTSSGGDDHNNTNSSLNARAVAQLAALQLEFYQNNTFISLIRLGIPQLNLRRKYGVASTAAVFDKTALLGGRNGELTYIDYTEDPENPKQLDLEGHAIYTNLTRFFPSGKVALSSGMDFTLKLWDVQNEEEKKPVQSLRHQKGLIDDVAMIGRGRNLLSLCCADQTVVQWEVSKPQVVNEFKVDEAQSLQLLHENSALVGTKSSVRILDLNAKEQTELIGGPALHLSAAQHFVARSTENNVFIHDIRNSHSPICEFETPTPIEQLVSTQSKLYIRTEAGLYAISYKTHEAEVLTSDSKIVSLYNDEVYTVGNDIRQFPL